MNYKSFLLTAALGFAMSSTAAAAPFYIELGQDFDGSGETRTADIGALGANNTLYTSFYDANPETGELSGGVMDTNIQSEMDARGFASVVGTANPSSHQTAPTNYRHPGVPGDVNVTGLEFDNPVTIDGENGFVANNWAGSNSSVWGLSFDYYIEGSLTDTGVAYDSGYFNIYFEQGGTNDRIQVLTMNLTGSALVAGDFNLFGEVDYSFLGEGDPNESFIQNMFVDVGTGKSFYELWSEDIGASIPVSWFLDTNVGGGLPDADDLTLITDAQGNPSLVRQTTGNATIRYQVPEPGMLILLGTGLLFLGFMATRRRTPKGGLSA
ncbi:PEP-CTERM sorting domain-containing protein [Thioalkalivibrio sp. ALJ1]|uniref:PEP-CTERM sorting domain-containing protein n=1 Tax=Thioalkalivibrio sp. ALJ1 TaxID=1158144 RepID=UPI00056FE9A9|nr:PEP-CTERM sorting domain-containing protein [Thioalkalivibrio sp. ALJ1]